MIRLDQYLNEALIKKDTKIFNNENTDNLVDDICDHLLIRITNHNNDEKTVISENAQKHRITQRNKRKDRGL